MRIFVDSSNIVEIKEFIGWGIVAGITTNPKILATDRNVVNYEQVVKEICKTVYPHPVSVEVVSDQLYEMVAEAEKFTKWRETNDNIAIKFPVTENGIKCIKMFSAKGVPINATCAMSAHQAWLAALAGARYASIFFGRVGDLGMDATQVVRDTKKVLSETKTELIVGSMRSVKDVVDSMLAGADIITITPQILKKMIQNPKTDETVKEFMDSWKKG